MLITDEEVPTDYNPSIMINYRQMHMLNLPMDNIRR